MKLSRLKSSIKLKDEIKKETDYKLLPVGTFNHPVLGELHFTKERIEKIIQNYKDGIPSYELPIDIEHNENEGSYGNIKEVYYDDGLCIKVEFDMEKLKDKGNFKYMSIDLRFDYLDRKTGNYVGETLVGAALTNRPGHPFVEELNLNDENNQNYYIEVETLNNQDVEEQEEAEEMTEIEKLKKELEEQKAETEKQKSANKALLNDKLAADKKAKKAEIEAKKTELIGKGIAPVIVDKAVNILLSDFDSNTQELKLNDGTTETTMKLSDAIWGLVEAIGTGKKKVELGQIGKEKIELNDSEIDLLSISNSEETYK